VVVPLTVLTIMFGELVPKVFALRNKEWVCLRLSPFMYWFSFFVHPIVWCLETGVLKLMHWGEKAWKKKLEPHGPGEAAELQELRASVALARTSRLIGAREERIILGAAALSQRPVKEIMLPAEFISLLNIESSMTDALISAHLDMHSRFPVSERPGDPQKIVGYVNFKDLVTYLRFMPDEPTLRPIVRNITSFVEDTPVAQCLERLIRGHAHIALVRDSRDQVVGIVTMEDMIEELVGEIEDEYDRLPAHVEAAGPGWIVGGGLGLAALRERTGIDLAADLPEARPRNVNEWVATHVDGPVRGGETIDRPTLRAVVRKSRRQKALEVLLQPRKPKAEGAAVASGESVSV
jgi:putative hemolysin